MRTFKKTNLAAAAVGVLVLLAGMGIAGSRNATAADVAISATSGNIYVPASVTANDGDRVLVTITGSFHDFNSSVVPAGGVAWDTAPAGSGTLSSAVLVPGTYTFYCSVHADPSDASLANVDANIASGEMVGKIIVSATAAASPTATNTATPTATNTATPTATSTAGTAATTTATNTPTASPTPTRTATATPTRTATTTPTAAATVAATPRPPATGTGTSSAAGSMLGVLLGLAAITTASATLVAIRKRSR